MEKMNRHIFSNDELLKLQNIIDKSNSEVELAEKALGKLKRSQLKLQAKHNHDARKYRYFYVYFYLSFPNCFTSYH